MFPGYVMGTMTFGLQTDPHMSHQIIDRAAEAGVNFIDTADVYPLGARFENVGRTEEIAGAGSRASVTVTSWLPRLVV